MSLIIDTIKKAQQLRLQELKGIPFFKGPNPKGEKRRIGRKYFLVLAASELGILLLLFLLGSHFFPLLRSQQSQKVVSIEKRDLSVYESSKNEYQEPRKEEVPPLQMEKSPSPGKPFTEEITEEPLKKSKVKKKKMEALTEAEGGKLQPPVPMKEEDLSKSMGSEPESKIEKRQTPPTPVPDQPIKNALPISPKQEVLAKPMGAELESEKNRPITSEILTHFNLGVDFYHQREILKAIQAYQKVIELDPTYAEAYNNMGIIYQEIGDFNKAFEAYQKSVDVNPQYEKAYNNMGILFYLHKRYDESIEAFQKALAINSNNIESHINLGTLFKKQGQVDKAIECYQKALSINPFHGEAHYNIGLLYEQLENVELAVSHYQTFINLSSKTHPDLVSKVQRRLNYLMATKGNKGK